MLAACTNTLCYIELKLLLFFEGRETPNGYCIKSRYHRTNSTKILFKNVAVQIIAGFIKTLLFKLLLLLQTVLCKISSPIWLKAA